MTDPIEQSMTRLLRKAKRTRDRVRGWHTKTTAQRKATRLNGDTMTPPGTDINCRCYDHHTDPLFIKLTTDYPGDWTPYKQGYRVKWGKVTAYVYRTGSDEEVCVEMVCLKETYHRKANSLVYLDDAFESCVEAIEYHIQSWHGDGLSKLSAFKDCPTKIREYLILTVNDQVDDAKRSIIALKEQLKEEQKNLRKANKLKKELGL